MTPDPPRKSDHVAHRRVGDGDVLLHLESGQYHGLNAIGSRIWALIDGRRSVTAIAAELEASIADAPDGLEEDVARFVAALRARDLVVG